MNSVDAHVHGRAEYVGMRPLDSFDLFACRSRVSPGRRQLLFVALAPRDHDLLVHRLLLVVALAVQVSHIVDLNLPLELCQAAGSVRVVLRESISDIVGHIEGRRAPLVSVLGIGAERELHSGAVGREVRRCREEDQEQNRQYLHRPCPLGLRILGMVLVVMRLVEHALAEERGKDVLGGVELLVVVVAMLLRDPVLVTIPVVDLLLLRIRQALHSLGQFLERLLSPWRLVLVGMQLERELLVGLLDHILIRVLGHL
mmetsp:Transcript_131692/g.380901  ORF Transcript_131692/g.380901 Transcript_131692/m.380901 type:complete len:257 (-) Transcript_131692:495-1265(-)